MVTDLVPTSYNQLLPASYDLLWSLTLVLVVVIPAVLTAVSYGVVRLAVRHELARRDRRDAQHAARSHA